MIRAKLTPPTTNGNGSAPAIYKHVPPDLRDDISEILETEGMMETSAENRILARMDKHQSETLSGIGELKETLHKHDTRLVLVEKDVIDLKSVADDVETLKTVAKDVALLNRAAETAAGERNKMAWLVKGSLVTAVMGIIIGALMSVYGTRQPVVREVQEAKQDVQQDTAELNQSMKELIKVLKVKAEQEAAPATTATPRRGRARSRPEPVPGPQINMLREGERIVTDPTVPFLTMRAASRQDGGLE